MLLSVYLVSSAKKIFVARFKYCECYFKILLPNREVLNFFLTLNGVRGNFCKI